MVQHLNSIDNDTVIRVDDLDMVIDILSSALDKESKEADAVSNSFKFRDRDTKERRFLLVKVARTEDDLYESQ